MKEKRPYLFLWAGVVMALVLIPCATDHEISADTRPFEVDYEVSLQGVPESSMKRDLESISDTVALQKRPPTSLYGLRQRSESDIPRFLKYLETLGHYGAQVHFEMDGKSKPVQVRFNFDVGPVYSLKSTDLEISGSKSELRKELTSLEGVGLESGVPADAKNILEAQKTLLREARNLGYAFAKFNTPQVLVDHDSGTAKIVLRLEPGPREQFGDTTISGLQSVDETVVRNKISWQEGETFQQKLLTEVHSSLMGTGLFSFVEVTHADSPPESGALPIRIRVRERKERTVGAGVSYKTDEGPGARVFWEHRNIAHKGEKLKLLAEASGITLGAEGTFTVPAFRRNDQSLILNSRIGRDDTDAYKSLGTRVSATVERELKKGLLVGAGPAYRLSRVDQKGDREDYALLYFPCHLFWDTTDDLLDPKKGGRLSLRAAPFYDMLGVDLGFVKASVGYSRYVGIWEKPRIEFAGRGVIGFLEGASRDRVPADERFYAGGGGSVRGYPYQTLGPLSDGDPVGGRSVIEMSFELRMKITETVGLVTFLDGGSAFESSFPDLDDPIRWGAGIGLRYYTAIGPLRLDLAFPLDRRDGVDDAFQVYVSIGQAF